MAKVNLGNVVGPQGPQGDAGKGDVYAFEIRGDGNLYIVYEPPTPAPDFSIDSNGNLIYTI